MPNGQNCLDKKIEIFSWFYQNAIDNIKTCVLFKTLLLCAGFEVVKNLKIIIENLDTLYQEPKWSYFKF